MTEKVMYTEVSNLNEAPPKDDDDVLERIIQHVGEIGTYQRWLILAMMPFGFAFGFLYSTQIFIAATPQEHWCRVPELQNLTTELRRNLSIPGAASGPDWDRCSMYDTNWTEILVTLKPPPNGTATIPCQNGWEFLYKDIPYHTVISERDWVCDRAGYAPFAQSMFFVGSLVGSSVFGWLGDAYGRLPALIGANLLGFVGGIATMFTSGIWDFTFSRFIAGMANDSCYMMIYIIIMEYVGPGHRTWVTNLTIALYCGGSLIISPFLALWLKDWRKLVLLTSMPMLFVLAAPWVVPESARWLASSGKVDKAVKVLKRFERINKRKIPEDVLDEFVVSVNKTSEADESIKALFQSVPLRNCVLYLILTITVSSVGLDAVIRLSESIGDNFFITFAVSASAEIPALLLVTLTLDRYGRRPVIFSTLSLAALFSFVCAFTPRGMMQMVLAVTMRFFVNMGLVAVFQMSLEVLPTRVRSTGSSIMHVTAFMGSVFSPYIVFSGRIWTPMPLVIVGAATVVASGVALLLPETKGKPMPQTMADGEKLVMSTMLCGKIEIDDDEELPPLELKKTSL